MAIIMKFWPAFMALVGSVLNAFAPEITRVVAEHPDIMLNLYTFLTVIANAINPKLNQPTLGRES